MFSNALLEIVARTARLFDAFHRDLGLEQRPSERIGKIRRLRHKNRMREKGLVTI